MGVVEGVGENVELEDSEVVGVGDGEGVNEKVGVLVGVGLNVGVV